MGCREEKHFTVFVSSGNNADTVIQLAPSGAPSPCHPDNAPGQDLDSFSDVSLIVIPNLFRDPVLILSEDGGPLTDKLVFPAFSGFLFFSAERFLAFLRKKDSW